MVDVNEKEDVQLELEPKHEWAILITGFLIMVALVFYANSRTTPSNELLNERTDEISRLRNQLGLRRESEQKIREKVIYETTGIDPERIRKDTSAFEDFIEDAFTWTSGEEYDQMRDEYIEHLGEESPFVQTYLAENMKKDGYNYVDTFNMKSKYVTKDTYPLEDRDGVMDYLGVVEYYLYNEKKDLVGINRLSTSKAFIHYSVHVDDDGNRLISNVSADPGFSDI